MLPIRHRGFAKKPFQPLLIFHINAWYREELDDIYPAVPSPDRDIVGINGHRGTLRQSNSTHLCIAPTPVPLPVSVFIKERVRTCDVCDPIGVRHKTLAGRLVYFPWLQSLVPTMSIYLSYITPSTLVRYLHLVKHRVPHDVSVSSAFQG